MGDDLWKSMPKTTNAEEAMHWKLYCAVGKELGLFEGPEGLFKFAESLQTLGKTQSCWNSYML